MSSRKRGPLSEEAKDIRKKARERNKEYKERQEKQLALEAKQSALRSSYFAWVNKHKLFFTNEITLDDLEAEFNTFEFTTPEEFCERMPHYARPYGGTWEYVDGVHTRIVPAASYCHFFKFEQIAKELLLLQQDVFLSSMSECSEESFKKHTMLSRQISLYVQKMTSKLCPSDKQNSSAQNTMYRGADMCKSIIDHFKI
jgi:hypothetical protein